MGWRRDSSSGLSIPDTEPMSRSDLLCRDEELDWLMAHQRRDWKLINGRIARSGDPVALQGTYTGVGAYPPAAALTAVTGAATILSWWTTSIYTPIPANGVLFPSGWRVQANGVITSSAVSQTITMTPAIGTGTIGAAPNAGSVSLGATGALSLGSATAITNMLWDLEGNITLRTGSTAGTAYGMFKMCITNVAGANATSANVLGPIIFGNTAATAIDFTGATANIPGLNIAGTASAAGVTATTNQILWSSWA